MPIGIRVTDLPAAAGTLDDDDEFLSLEDGSLRRATRAQAGPKASIVQVADTANQFTGTNVEGVLAEIQDNVDALVISGGGISVASEAEALAGTDNTKAMTPLRVRTVLPYISVKEYGATGDGVTDDHAAILDALDSNPGKCVWFPAGDYRLDSSLLIEGKNSLLLHPDARIFAGTAMTTMIEYKSPTTGITTLSEDHFLKGGTLDGNLLADNVLVITRVIRFALEGVEIRDGIHRGLITDIPGAHVYGRDLRFVNSGITNATDNIAIENNMGDCHFSDVVTRDWTIGVQDTGAGKWLRCHSWLGTDTQLAARYPGSIAFDCGSHSDLIGCYADTYETGFNVRCRLDGLPSYVRVRGATVYWNPSNLSAVFSNANLGTVANVDDTTTNNYLRFDDGWMQGHPGPGATSMSFVTGNTAWLYAHNNIGNSVTGPFEWEDGIAQGRTTWTPEISAATTPGSHSYISRGGTCYVVGETVRYRFNVRATLDGTIDGNLRIAGVPLPLGAASVGTGHGPVNYSVGQSSDSLIGGGFSSATGLLTVISRPSSEIGSVALRTTTIEIWGQYEATLTPRT